MQFLQGNNLPRVKASNQSAILRMIYYYGPIQRAEIAEQLELTLPTITTNINKMLADGLVKETSMKAAPYGSNGRRARLLEINAQAGYFAGLEFKSYQWSISITDFCGNLLNSKRIVQKNTDYEKVMEQLGRDFTECLADSGKSLKDLSGIGISLPGLVDRRNGILKVSTRHQWKNKNVRDDFARLTGYQGKITLENNATARGLSAQLFHWNELEKGQSFAYLFVALGVACPLFLNTSSYRGSVVGAGEAGHMIIKPRGRLCSCGNHGCLEAYASEYAIINDCKMEMEQGRAEILREICSNLEEPEISEILKAQEAGDKSVCHIIEEAIYRLAIAASNIINFTRPDMMLIDCQLFQSEYNRRIMLDNAQKNLYSPTYPGTEIFFVDPDKSANALGAVAVAIDEKMEISM